MHTQLRALCIVNGGLRCLKPPSGGRGELVTKRSSAACSEGAMDSTTDQNRPMLPLDSL